MLLVRQPAMITHLDSHSLLRRFFFFYFLYFLFLYIGLKSQMFDILPFFFFPWPSIFVDSFLLFWRRCRFQYSILVIIILYRLVCVCFVRLGPQIFLLLLLFYTCLCGRFEGACADAPGCAFEVPSARRKSVESAHRLSSRVFTIRPNKSIEYR